MANQYPDKERRKFKRIKKECIVMSEIVAPAAKLGVSGDKEFNSIILDLCADGMAFLTHNAIPRSVSVANKFVLMNDKASDKADLLKPVEVRGEVLYNLKEVDGKYRTGIRFTNITDDVRCFINKLEG